jgi:hypothetical protein
MSRPTGFFLMSLPPSPSATVSIQNSSPKHASEIRSFLSIIRNRVNPWTQLNTHFGELLCVQHRRFSSGRYGSPQQVSETSSVPILGKGPTGRTIVFYVFIFICNSLHVSSTSCSSSGETNFVNTASGNCHSVSVAVSCAGREWTSDLLCPLHQRIPYGRHTACLRNFTLLFWSDAAGRPL